MGNVGGGKGLKPLVPRLSAPSKRARTPTSPSGSADVAFGYLGEVGTGDPLNAGNHAERVLIEGRPVPSARDAAG